MNSVIGALRVNLGIDTAEFQDGLKRAQAGLAKFGALAKQGLVMAAEAAGAALGDLAHAVKDTIDAADGMVDVAERLGLPLEELSRLKYAADISGASFDALQAGLERLTRNMSAAKDGIGPMAKMFEDIGISVTNADGSLKSASTVLSEIADHFAGMPDGAEQAAEAMRLLGNRGADLVPMLGKGSQALAALKAEASTFGQVFTAEMGADAASFNDNVQRLQGTLAAVAARIATDVLPHLVRLSDWLVTNGPALVAFASDLTRIGAAIGGFAAWIGNAVAAMGPWGEAMTLGIVGVVRFGERIAALSMIVANFFAGLAQQIGGLLSGAWASFEAAWDTVVAKVNGFAQAVAQMAANAVAAVQNMVMQITDWLTTKLAVAWDSVIRKVKDVGGWFEWLYDKTVGNSWIPDMVTEIGQWMGQLGNMMVAPAEAAAKQTGAAFAGIGDSFNGIFSSFGSSIADAIKGTKSWTDVLKDLLSQIAKVALSGLSKSFGGGFGGFLSSLLGGLVGFADGGNFQVGGAGGVDSQLVAFKASPNETVSITKPGQGGGGGAVDVRVYVDQDGNWKAAVERIAARTTAAGIQQAAPGLMSGSVASTQAAMRNRPGFTR